MIVYNVTIKIQNSVREEWVRYMQQQHIPDVLNTGCFTAYRFHHLLEQDDAEDTTYVIQYIAHDIETYFRYRDTYAPGLQADVAKHFGDKFVSFRTLMEQLV